MKLDVRWLVALFALLFAADLVAQDRGERQAPDLFFESVDVSVVNVEVHVTDRKGERVLGLTAGDFELLEDGRPVEITNFYAVEDGRPADPAASVKETAPQQPPAAGRQPEPAPVPVPESQRLHLILYFDNEFLRPFNRNRVVREVRGFLARTVGPQDRVMLVTFDKELHRRHPFTSDMRAMGEALDEIKTLTGAAVQAETERRDVLQRVDRSRSVSEAESDVDFYAKSVFFQLGQSIEALKRLIGSLAGLPGRKALLYVSDGIPMSAAEDLFYYLDQKYPERIPGMLLASRYSARRKFRDLTAHANANRVTFYTLEAAGLDFHSSLSAESGGTTSGGSTLDVDFYRDSSNQQALMMMAFETGGQATFNSNNISGALDRMAADFGSYYSLGYQPVHAEPGRYHRIEVRVKKPGLKVRHRTGYRDKTAEARQFDATMASLFYGFESNPLEIELEVEGAARPQDDGQYLVPVLVRIPLGKVTLIPYQNLHRALLQVSLGAIDEEGRVSGIQQATVPIDVPNSDLETARRQYFAYGAELLMRKGYQEVAVGVRDQYQGESSFVRLGVWAGDPVRTPTSAAMTDSSESLK